MKNTNPKVEIDNDLYDARVDGELLHLTALEFELLNLLMQNRGRVLTREYLEQHTRTTSCGGRSVDVYVGYLRKKLGFDAIKSRKGFGYYIEK